MDTFQQPQLGQTIQALRQEKKLTQEELVEQCNLNVRTLQRIEAGEVTPRDYTIKAILSALDYEFEQVELSIKKKVSLNRMQIGWIAGIVYFVLGFIEAGVDYSRFDANNSIYYSLVYTVVKALSLISFGLLMIGFVEVGKTFKSSLLKIGSYLMLGSFAVIEIYDIVSIFSTITEEEFWLIKGSEAVILRSRDERWRSWSRKDSPTSSMSSLARRRSVPARSRRTSPSAMEATRVRRCPLSSWYCRCSTNQSCAAFRVRR